MTAVTQLQAAGLVVAFAMALSLTVSITVLVAALRYEYQDRKRRRARRGLVTVPPRTVEQAERPPAPVFPLSMARSRREQQGVRRSNGRWSA